MCDAGAGRHLLAIAPCDGHFLCQTSLDSKHLCHYRLLLQLLLQFLCRHSHLLRHRHHLLRHRQQNLLLVAQEGKGSRSRDGHDRRQRKGDGSTSVDCDDGDNNGNNGNSDNNGSKRHS